MGTKLTEVDNILYQSIDRILWQEWDPIGVNTLDDARDEYYSYIPSVFKMVKDRASQTQIADYLFEVETKKMGLLGDRSNCARVAQLLLKL